MKSVSIWDGVSIRQVDEKTAKKLVKADKGQILSDKFISGTELKYRKQFTGYHTREMRVERPEPPSQPEPSTQPEAPVMDTSNWMQFRKAAADHLGIPYNKVKKVQVIKYMEENHA